MNIYEKYIEALKQSGFQGDMSLRAGDRITYATDNSIYQIMPAGVIFPESVDDVVTAMKLTADGEFSEVSFSARGGGTGTNGQSLNDGLIMDFSRYMTEITEVNIEEGWVKVQAGVVKDRLDEFLKPMGYFFAPDLSTSSRATIGGMINTDACGQGSRVYGKTSDHVLEITFVDSSGNKADLSSTVSAEDASLLPAGDLARKILETLEAVGDQFGDLIRETFPPINRSLTGYNLKDAALEKLNPVKLISGSEGTLGFVCEAKLKILPIPAFSRLVLVKYSDFISALRSAHLFRRVEPIAVETVDGTVINLAKKDEVWEVNRQYFPASEDDALRAVNIVEFKGDTEDEVDQSVQSLLKLLEEYKDSGYISNIPVRPEDTQSIWNMRKKGVGLLGNMEGDAKPVAFVEDCAVAPEKLADFISDFRDLLDNEGLKYGMYGHVDSGCIHVRPALNMRSEISLPLVRKISDKVNELVRSYGGVIWGEHGRGVRGEYTAEYFGPALYEVLQKIKTLFDPFNRLNPGKLVMPLNYDGVLAGIDTVPTRGQSDREIKSELLEKYIPAVNCNGNGACFHYSPDYVMCPSYKGMNDRIHSPKGRAGLIREWVRELSVSDKGKFFAEPSGFFSKRMNGILKRDGFTEELKEAMDGCLACKACTTQCPIKVDIPEMRSEFYSTYFSKYPRKMRDYLIGSIENIGSISSRFPRISNFFQNNPLSLLIAEKVFGFCDPPRYAIPSLQAGLDALGYVEYDLPSDPDKKTVVVIRDAFNAFYDPITILDTCRLLHTLGYRVICPPFVPNGKALHIKGFLNKFRKVVAENLKSLRKYHEAGLPVLFLEPGVAMTYRQEIPHFFESTLIPGVSLFQEWFWEEISQNDIVHEVITEKVRYGLYSHCTEKTAHPDSPKIWQKIFLKAGLSLDIQPSGCCGMAGVFGHEKPNREISEKIYNSGWKDKVESENDVIPLATGYSCRSQVKRFSAMKISHPVSALAYHLT